MGLQNRTTKSSYMATEDVSGAEQPSEARRTRSRSRQTKQSTSQNLSLTTRGEHSDMGKYGYESLASRTKLAPPENPSKEVLSSAHPTTTDHQVQNKTRAASRARLRSTSYRNKDSQNSGSVDEPRSAWKNRKTTPRNNASYIPDRSRSRVLADLFFQKANMHQLPLQHYRHIPQAKTSRFTLIGVRATYRCSQTTKVFHYRLRASSIGYGCFARDYPSIASRKPRDI